jgi:hypothetical protein
VKVEVKRNREDKKPLIVDYDFGRDVGEAIALFNNDGPYGDVVHDLFITAAKMQLRAFVLDGGLTGAALASAVAAWKPEIKHMGKPPLEKAKAIVGKLSPEERAALLKQLQASA